MFHYGGWRNLQGVYRLRVLLTHRCAAVPPWYKHTPHWFGSTHGPAPSKLALQQSNLIQTPGFPELWGSGVPREPAAPSAPQVNSDAAGHCRGAATPVPPFLG